jgi:hypothetical protein
MMRQFFNMGLAVLMGITVAVAASAVEAGRHHRGCGGGCGGYSDCGACNSCGYATGCDQGTIQPSMNPNTSPHGVPAPPATSASNATPENSVVVNGAQPATSYSAGPGAQAAYSNLQPVPSSQANYNYTRPVRRGLFRR